MLQCKVVLHCMVVLHCVVVTAYYDVLCVAREDQILLLLQCTMCGA